MNSIICNKSCDSIFKSKEVVSFLSRNENNFTSFVFINE